MLLKLPLEEDFEFIHKFSTEGVGGLFQTVLNGEAAIGMVCSRKTNEATAYSFVPLMGKYCGRMLDYVSGFDLSIGMVRVDHVLELSIELEPFRRLDSSDPELQKIYEVDFVGSQEVQICMPVVSTTVGERLDLCLAKRRGTIYSSERVRRTLIGKLVVEPKDGNLGARFGKFAVKESD